MDTGEGDVRLEVFDRFQSFKSKFQVLTSTDQLTLLNELLNEHATAFHKLSMPDDFLHLSLMSMQHLDSFGKVNVLYELAKGLGTLRPNSTEPVFPISRMPFGLLQYIVTFFNSKSGNQV